MNPDVFKLVSCSSTLATHVFHYAHFEFDLSNTLAAKDWGKKKNKQKKESARGMSWSGTRVGMKRSFLLESQRFTFSKNLCTDYDNLVTSLHARDKARHKYWIAETFRAQRKSEKSQQLLPSAVKRSEDGAQGETQPCPLFHSCVAAIKFKMNGLLSAIIQYVS